MLGRQKITESQAVGQVRSSVSNAVQQKWQAIYSDLRGMFGAQFVIPNESLAKYDLSLAATALDMQALPNLFSAEQARRIEKWIYVSIAPISAGFPSAKGSREQEEYARGELHEYGKAFQEDLAALTSGNSGLSSNPVDAVSHRLLHRWLGEHIAAFGVELAGKNTGLISPILIMAVSAILCQFPFVGGWKQIQQNFDLIPEDLPFEMKSPNRERNLRAEYQTGDSSGPNSYPVAQPAKGSTRTAAQIIGLGLWCLIIGAAALGALYGALVGNWSNILSVLVLFIGIVTVFGICVSAIRAKRTVTDPGSRPGNWTFLALIVPIASIFYMAGYTDPPAPQADLLAYGLANLGYTLGFAALVFARVDFEILGLRRRSAKWFAAIFFFVMGTALANLSAIADLPRGMFG